MTPFTWLGSLTALAIVVTWIGTGAAIWALRRLGALAAPNARSSHVQPTPNGGGIVAVSVVLALWWWSDATLRDSWGVIAWGLGPVLASAAALAVLSLLDDIRRSLSPIVRLLAHVLAVVAGLLTLPGPVFYGLPYWADIALTAIAWVWFINLFNFMDGIDGIAGVEIAAIAAGVALAATMGGMPPIVALYGMTVAAAAMGFLLWNWQPARVFLGDAGSIPFGYLLGWLLLVMAARGHWAPALLLPMYFVADATLMLLRRLVRGEKVWVAHKNHAYQRAARALGSHAAVSLRVAALNVALIALAMMAVRYPDKAWLPLLAGLALTGWLLWYFERAAAAPEAVGPQPQQPPG
jgi:UDP-N-acetylmuramyl pentapeptide phosphotransferase/UDP-N-acetylglucosamine-1-phosphate transferase